MKQTNMRMLALCAALCLCVATAAPAYAESTRQTPRTSFVETLLDIPVLGDILRFFSGEEPLSQAATAETATGETATPETSTPETAPTAHPERNPDPGPHAGRFLHTGKCGNAATHRYPAGVPRAGYCGDAYSHPRPLPRPRSRRKKTIPVTSPPLPPPHRPPRRQRQLSARLQPCRTRPRRLP